MGAMSIFPFTTQLYEIAQKVHGHSHKFFSCLHMKL